METLKYRLIKSKKQYAEYCTTLQALLTGNDKSKATKDEVELLTLLIEKWDAEHNTFDEVDPITLLKSLMQENKITSTNLAEILNVSKGLISDILNYKKGISMEVIRRLADYFKVSHEAFNRAYEIKIQSSNHKILA